MKAEDLMVGDWVYLVSTIHNVSFPDNGVIQDEGYITTRTPIKITTVSENCISYYSNKLELYITLSSEDIEPIPLTPEILEKNGLANDPYGCHFKEDEYMMLEISVEEEGIYWTINYNEYAILKLKYVHQLQHALRLCEINKEIVV